jgi:hypothetical protein
LPPLPSPRIAAYYVSVLLGLGAVVYFMPGRGFSGP